MATASDKAGATVVDTFIIRTRHRAHATEDLAIHWSDRPHIIAWERLPFLASGGADPSSTRVTTLEDRPSPYNDSPVYREWDGMVGWPLDGMGVVYRFNYNEYYDYSGSSDLPIDHDVEAEIWFEVSGAQGWSFILGRMSATGFSHNSVDRYQIAISGLSATSSPLIIVQKVISGLVYDLASYTKVWNNGIYRLEMRDNGDNVNVRVLDQAVDVDGPIGSLVERISITDGLGVGLGGGHPRVDGPGMPGIAPAGRAEDQRAMDNFYVIPIIIPKSVTDTLNVGITEAPGVTEVMVFKTATDTLNANVTEVYDSLVVVTKDGYGDDLNVDITEVPILKNIYQLSIKAGLLTDVIAGKVISQWNADQMLIPGIPGDALTLGSTPDYVYDSAVGKRVVNVTDIPITDFESMLLIHLGSMFPANGVRGALQAFIRSSWESDNRPYIRASIIMPQAAYPLTQDPAYVEMPVTSRYRHLPIGVTSWPHGVAASEKIRSGQITHDVGGLSDILKVSVFSLQAITEAEDSALKISGLDILPVEDGYFAIEPITESNQTAIQRGDALVMDGISNPPGGYAVRRAAGDGVENINTTSLIPIHGSPLELLPNKENVITFIAGQWSSEDEAGEYQGDVLFNSWIEYEPRFIFV